MRIKRFFIFILFFCLSCSITFASLLKDFETIYLEEGIDAAVIAALSEGAELDLIVKTALPLKGMKKDALFKALYCAVAQPDAIQEAATINRVKESTVREGYQLALAECSRQMDENLNAALDTSQKYPGSISSSKQSRRTNYSSPATFE